MSPDKSTQTEIAMTCATCDTTDAGHDGSDLSTKPEDRSQDTKGFEATTTTPATASAAQDQGVTEQTARVDSPTLPESPTLPSFDLDLLQPQTNEATDSATSETNTNTVTPYHYDSDSDDINDTNTPVLLRDPQTVTLAITIQVRAKSHQTITPQASTESSSSSSFTFTFTTSASNCTSLMSLRDLLVAKNSQSRSFLSLHLLNAAENNCLNLDQLVQDLDRVTFKLEEDGHVATMNMTPARVDRSRAFPAVEYEAWFWRNVRRGHKASYGVQVNVLL
ncbi:hypothetical protein KCU88_g6683, partial [Aureobasidium melanogenum]